MEKRHAPSEHVRRGQHLPHQRGPGNLRRPSPNELRGDVHHVIREYSRRLRGSQSELARLTENRVAAQFRVPTGRGQARNPGGRSGGLGLPQDPAVAHEVAHVVQGSLHDPEYLEVQEPPRPSEPKDVGGSWTSRYSGSCKLPCTTCATSYRGVCTIPNIS